jgi:hypothetical protein
MTRNPVKDFYFRLVCATNTAIIATYNYLKEQTL